MGQWLVLVSPCFRKNVDATCKIMSFLCSLDTLLQKNVIVFFFWKSYFKMALIWKKGLFLTYFSPFLVTRNKLQIFLQHISHSSTYTYFAHPIDFFALGLASRIVPSLGLMRSYLVTKSLNISDTHGESTQVLILDRGRQNLASLSGLSPNGPMYQYSNRLSVPDIPQWYNSRN